MKIINPKENKFFNVSVIPLILLMISVLSINAQTQVNYDLPATKQGATEFVEVVSADILSLLKEAKQSDEKDLYIEKISGKFEQAIDLKSAVRQIMGPAFASSTSQQKNAFLKEFSNSLINQYSSLLLEFEIKSMTVKEVKFKTGKTPKALVQVSVVTNSLQADLVYFLSYKKNGWKMTNFAFDGSDVTQVMRNIFLGAYLSANKDLDKVIANWEKLMQPSS